MITKEFLNKLEKPTEFLTNENEILENLKRMLFENISKINEKVAITFSGGVDSTLVALICEKLKKEFKLYVVGLENSKDIKIAKKLAKERNWELEIKILSEEELEEIVEEVVKIVGVNAMKVSIGCVLYSCLRLIKEKVVLSGGGTEDVFAGYKRIREAKDINEACLKSLKTLWERDIERDQNISKNFNIKLEYPFLNEEFISYGLRIKDNLKVNEKGDKYVIRKLAFSLGLSEEYAFRPKLAAQYGSNFDKGILKLAKKNGFKHKLDYLKNLKGPAEI